MSRRLLLATGLVALLLSALAFAPSLPPVRALLLDRVQALLADNGVELTYAGSSGNAWRRVGLEGVVVEAGSSRLELAELVLDYRLPSLLGGELPLDVRVAGVDGNLDLATLAGLLPADAAPRRAGPRVLLGKVDVSDLNLAAANVPFKLPDASITDLRVTDGRGYLEFGARVVTADGAVDVSGRYVLATGDVTGTVDHADVGVARYWWPGAVAGSAAGTFSVVRGQVVVELDIVDGVVEQSGLTATNVRGSALMNYPLIDASLVADTLGGPLAAEGRIDVEAERYDIDVDASPRADAAAAWVAELLGTASGAAPAAGELSVTGKVTGWKEVTVTAAAEGTGTLLGLDLGVLVADATVRVEGKGDVAVRGDVRVGVGGGAIVATVSPTPGGHQLTASATDVGLLGLDLAGVGVGGFSPGGRLVNVTADLEQTQGAASPLSGTFRAEWATSVGGNELTVRSDGQLDGDGLQAYASADLATDGGAPVTATGALVLADGQLDAGASVDSLVLPGLSDPVRLGLTATGPTSDLRLSLAVENALPLGLELPELFGPALTASAADGVGGFDLRGTARARLSGGSVTLVDGAFGPLTLTGGSYDFAAGAGSLSAAAEPVLVGSPTEGAPLSVLTTVEGLTATYAGGDLRAGATLHVADLRVGPVLPEIAELIVEFGLTVPEAAQRQSTGDADPAVATAPPVWHLSVSSGGALQATLSSAGDDLAVVADGLVVALAGAGGGDRLSAELSGGLQAEPTGYSVELALAPGAALGALTLEDGASLSGFVDPASARAQLAGALGEVPVEGSAEWASGSLEIAVAAAGVSLTANTVTGSWQLLGEGRVDPLLALVGLDVGGITLDGRVSYSDAAGYEGGAVVGLGEGAGRGDAAPGQGDGAGRGDGAVLGPAGGDGDARTSPYDARLTLEGAGPRLALGLTGSVAGLELVGAGELVGPLTQALSGGPDGAGQGVQLSLGLGPFTGVVVDLAGVRGAGTSEAVRFGPVAVEPLPWEVSFDWGSASGAVSLGGERLDLRLDDGGFVAAGSAAARFAYGAGVFVATVALDTPGGEPVSFGDVAEVPLTGSVRAATPGAPELVSFRGTPAQLLVTAGAPLQLLAAPLPDGARPAGHLDLTAQVSLLDGPTYSGSMKLVADLAAAQPKTTTGPSSGGTVIDAEFTGAGSAFDLAAAGVGLELSYVPASGDGDGSFVLTATDLALDDYLPPGARGRAAGSLRYSSAGWGGELTAGLSLPAVALPAATAGLGEGPTSVTIDARLEGAGERLLVALVGDAGPSASLSASGTLLPQPAVAGTFELLGAATGTLRWDGVVTAELVTEPLDLAGLWLDAVPLLVTYDPTDGSGSVTTAPAASTAPASLPAAVAFRLDGAGVSGEATVPFRWEPPGGGEAVRAELAVAASGPLTDPVVRATLRVEGEDVATAAGTAAEGLEVEAAVSGELLRTLLTAGGAERASELLDGPVTLRAAVAQGGGWSATAGTSLTATPRGSDDTAGLRLALSAAGSGLQYDGAVVVTSEPAVGSPSLQSTIATLPFRGYGLGAEVDADLASFDWPAAMTALGLPADIGVTGSGTVQLRTSPFRIGYSGGLTAGLAGYEVRLTGELAEGTSFGTLDVGVGGPGVSLAGTLAPPAGGRPGFRLGLTGDILEEAASVGASVATDLSAGDLVLIAGDVELSATLALAAGGDQAARELSFAGTAGGVSLSPVPATVAGKVVGEPGSGWRVTDLVIDASAAGAVPAAHAELSGPLTPELVLAGSLRVADLAEPATVTVTDWSQPTASVDWRDLGLAASSGGEGVTVRLYGSLTGDDAVTLFTAVAPAGAGAVTEAVAMLEPRLEAEGLAWSPAGGWVGAFNGGLSLPWLATTASLTGHADSGDLVVTAEAATAGASADASVRLGRSPWSPGAPLSGSVRLAAAAGELLGLPAVDANLQLDGELGGTLASPQASGLLSLSGASTASGSFSVDGDLGNLSLAGPAGTVDGALSLTELSFDGTVSDLDLGLFARELAGGKASFDATVDPTRATVGGLTVNAPGLTGSGSADLEWAAATGDGSERSPTLTAELSGAVDLTSLGDLAQGLAGTVRATVSVDGAPLFALSDAEVAADLRLADVGIGGFDGTASGWLTVSGTVSDPTIRADLSGGGALGGGLVARIEPGAGLYTVRSDASYGDVVTDLDLVVDGDSVSATGTVRTALGGFTFVEPTDTPPAGGAAQVLKLSGDGGFAGVVVELALDELAARVTGDLASLADGLEGHVDAVLSPTAPNWLTGAVTGVRIAGVELGDMLLGSGSEAAAGGRALVTLTGDDVRASIEPASLSWELVADSVPTNVGGVQAVVSLTGSGVGARGSLAGVVLSPAGPAAGGLESGAAGLPATELELSLELGAGGSARVNLHGTVLGGDAQLTGTRQAQGGAWDGAGRLAGVVAGPLVGDATLQLGGTDLVPVVSATTQLTGPVTATGTLEAGLSAVTFTQRVSGGPLAEEVELSGSLLPDQVLVLHDGVAGAAGVTLASSPTDEGQRLGAEGTFRTHLGPLRLQLAGSGGVPVLTVSSGLLPGGSLTAPLEAPDLLALVGGLYEDGVTLTGDGNARGTISLDPAAGALTARGFGVDGSAFSLTADGKVGLSGGRLQGSASFTATLPTDGETRTFHLPWTVNGEAGVWQLDSASDVGTVLATFDQASPGAARAVVSLVLGEGQVGADLSLGPNGLVGDVLVHDVRFVQPDVGDVTVDVAATVTDSRVEGTATLQSPGGRATVTGDWGLQGLLPAALTPGAGTAPAAGRLEARLRSFDVSSFPFVKQQLPLLRGELSGVVQLRDDFVFGQLLASDLGAEGFTTPLELSLNGPLTSVNIELQARGAIGRASLDGGSLSGVMQFERFPLTLLSAVAVGPADFSADLTGVMRFEVPLADPAAGYVRLATEEVRLERVGIETFGNLAATYANRRFEVQHAEFEGSGSWTASGVVAPDAIDLRVRAVDADFTPLLGLAPSLARLGFGATGSFELVMSGDAADPTASLSSSRLGFEVAGSAFELSGLTASLTGTTARLDASLAGVAPVTGELGVSGTAEVGLFPASLTNVRLSYTGSLDVAGIGPLTGVEGTLSGSPADTLELAATGTLGSGTLDVSGTAWPLDLALRGTNLTASLPAVMVERALVDVDLTLASGDDVVALGGTVLTSAAILDPGSRNGAAPGAVEGPVGPGGQALSAGVSTDRDAVTTNGQAAEGGMLFDSLRVLAPNRVSLATNFGSFEAGLDLTLTGRTSDPRIAGTVTGLRGNLRFAGRDFTLDRAIATFSPSRGVYPELDVVAHAEFDKSRSLPGTPNVRFVQPRTGNGFEVTVSFNGPVEAAPGGGITFDAQPSFRSDALIEVDGNAGAASTTRPFTDAELLALVTLGRFELSSELMGSGGLGEAVATGALDTAVDVLLVANLENAIREALGLDLVEIRTPPISTLLANDGQAFGVSLRLGTYLTQDVFGSYRIGPYQGTSRDFVMTNEVLLRYDLGTVDFDLIGTLDVPYAGSLVSPRANLGVLVNYRASPTLGVDTGLRLGTDSSAFEFGITISW